MIGTLLRVECAALLIGAPHERSRRRAEATIASVTARILSGQNASTGGGIATAERQRLAAMKRKT